MTTSDCHLLMLSLILLEWLLKKVSYVVIVFTQLIRILDDFLPFCVFLWCDMHSHFFIRLGVWFSFYFYFFVVYQYVISAFTKCLAD
jgi:hypothetical protein